MATPITGVNGAIDGQKCIEEWIIRPMSKLAVMVCASTDGAELNDVGNVDWKGRYIGKGHTPFRMPGNLWTFTGSSRDGKGYEGSAYTQRARIIWPVNQGKFIYHMVDFAQGQGALNRGAYTATDTGSPDPDIARALTMSLDGSDVANMQHMELIIECPSAKGPGMQDGYVSADTNGLVYRDAGNVRAFLQGLVLFSDPSDLPVENSVHAVHLNVDSTPIFWDINWFRMFDIESKMVIHSEGDTQARFWACSFKGRWTGWKDGSKGHIIQPDLTVFWD